MFWYGRYGLELIWFLFQTIVLFYRNVSLSPLALPQCPGGDDPEADHEHQQHRPGADGHQGLQDEPADGESDTSDTCNQKRF